MLGQTSSTTPSFGGFGSGSTNSTGGGLFGAKAGSVGSAPSGGLFGQSNAQQPQQQPNTSGGLFGSKPTGSTGGGLFGQSNTTGGTGGLFGQSNQQQQQQQPSLSGGLFGNAQNQQQQRPSQPQLLATGGGLFGQLNQQQAPTGGGLFAQQNQQQPTTGGGLFGGSLNTNTGGGLFGKLSNTTGGLFGSGFTSQPSGGIIGGGNNTGQSSGGLFGNNNTSTQTSGGLFSSNTNQSSGGLFGNKPAVASGLFGPTSQPQQQQQQQQQQQSNAEPQLSAMTRVGDLPPNIKNELQQLDTYINTQHLIATTLNSDMTKHDDLINTIPKDITYLQNKSLSTKQALKFDTNQLQDLKNMNNEITEDINNIMQLIIQLSTPGTRLSSSYQLNEFFIKKIKKYYEVLNIYEETINELESVLNGLERNCSEGFGSLASIVQVIKSQYALFMDLCETMAQLHNEINRQSK